MPRIRNRIISDSDSDTDSNRYNLIEDDVPLSERWKNLRNQRKWKIPTATVNFEPQVFGYTDPHSGVLHESGISENSSPLSIFEFFFCEELVQLIVKDSNNFICKQGLSRMYCSISSEDIYCVLPLVYI